MQKRKKNKKNRNRKSEKQKIKERNERKEQRWSKYQNGREIFVLMKDNGIKGDVRDYMILTENMMIDYRSSYTVPVVSSDGRGLLNFGAELKLVHKKNLYKLIGEAAKRYWHPFLGRIVDVKEGTKKA